jgi:hypothetical protein
VARLVAVATLLSVTGCGGSSPTAPDTAGHWMLGTWEGSISGLEGILRVEIVFADELDADGTATFNDVHGPAPGAIAIRLDRGSPPTDATLHLDFFYQQPASDDCGHFVATDARANVTANTLTGTCASDFCDGRLDIPVTLVLEKLGS